MKKKAASKARPRKAASKTKPTKIVSRAKPGKAGTTAKPEKGPVVAFRFTGALEVEKDRKGRLHAVIYSSAAEALHAGVHPEIVKRLFRVGSSMALPIECSTVGESRKEGIWVTCMDHACQGQEGCHIGSWPRDDPNDWRDEGDYGTWALPGRVYQCTCLYSG